jgi:hypothetical protein
MKLFRYRPLNSFLFKELNYNEIYMATYAELNDPQDLKCEINFHSTKEDQVFALAHFIYKRLIHAHGVERFGEIYRSEITYETLGKYLHEKFSSMSDRIVNNKTLGYYLSGFYSEYVNKDRSEFSRIDVTELLSSLSEVTNVFLKNSSVACFSESCDNFLMWSHYANGHRGVCLEFDIKEMEPRVKNGSPNLLLSRVNQIYEGEFPEYWTELFQVAYCADVSIIDFYQFYHGFDNKGDIDLMNLSKLRWHPYAEYLRSIFIKKQTPWSYEREWRIVNVQFKETMPEERIITYSDSALKSVCFGEKVSVFEKLRIAKILNDRVEYFECSANGSGTLDIKELDMDALKESYQYG